MTPSLAEKESNVILRQLQQGLHIAYWDEVALVKPCRYPKRHNAPG